MLRSPTPARALLREGAARLREAGIERAALESRLLLCHALGATQADLLRDPDRPVPAEGFAALLSRRAAREPLALILGRREFWSLDLAVSRATLIPRPESETLIEAALACMPDRRSPRAVLDLGTGTGALLLAALTEFPSAFGLGLDRSEAACVLARGNAAALGLGGRAGFAVADWAAPVVGRFDLVLCNPPYIPRGEIASLMPEVARYRARLGARRRSGRARCLSPPDAGAAGLAGARRARDPGAGRRAGRARDRARGGNGTCGGGAATRSPRHPARLVLAPALKYHLAAGPCGTTLHRARQGSSRIRADLTASAANWLVGAPRGKPTSMVLDPVARGRRVDGAPGVRVANRKA